MPDIDEFFNYNDEEWNELLGKMGINPEDRRTQEEAKELFNRTLNNMLKPK